MLIDPDRPADILVVDDLADNLRLLGTLLRGHGYKVRPATNGEDALEAVRLCQPDLVLLDIRMPGMDGFEVCRRLQADAASREIPVIFVTASVDPEGAAKGLKLGAVDYVLKPFREEEVLARVHTHIELYRMRRQLALESQESRARYRRLVEGLKDEYFFYVCGADGTFTYLSPSVEQVLGYSPDEFLTHYTEYLTENECNRLASTHTEAGIQGELRPSYEVEVRRKDGGNCWLEVKQTPLLDDEGMPAGIEGIAHDITARKEAGEALLTSQHRLEEAQRLGHIGHWELILPGHELYWSTGVFPLFGLTPDEFTPTHPAWLAFIHGDERDAAKSALEALMQTGTPIDRVQRITRSDNRETRYLHQQASAVLGDDGKVARMIGTLQDVTDNVLAEKELQHYQERIRTALKQAVQGIAKTVEQRDPYTAGHQQHVAELATAIAAEMGLDEHRIEGIGLGGMIHDIGKIHVPAEILAYPGKLADAEFSIIKKHARIGYEILNDTAFPWPVANMVHQHHERLDGHGYPQGLKEDEICLEAKILAVADVVEAMASDRPYRPGLGIEAALREIESGRGGIYDADVTDACLNLFRNKGYNFDCGE
ncbi:MAG: HD domain-containing phosphohydrolase [Candidatus Sedimenticola sp. 20ELBAFRAG]